MKWLIAGTLVALGGCATSMPTTSTIETPSRSPSPSPSPAFADDPVVKVTPNDTQHSFTITATNPSKVACHHLALHVLGESGSNPNPQQQLDFGISDGKVTDYTDVEPGQTVSQTLDAYAILKSLPADQSFAVGATGYCLDRRNR